MVTAASVVLLLASLVWLSRTGDRPGSIPAEILNPVVEAVETASSRGSFVIPGGEAAAKTVPAGYRSGYIRIDESLTRSFRYLSDVVQGYDPPVDAVCLLIAGYVSTGQIDIARDITADSRKHNIDDVRLDNLEALIAMIDGDIERADSIFRGILTVYPEDAIAALNYSVFLSESGRDTDAMILLDGIIDRHPGTWMSKRASHFRETVKTR